MLRYIIIHMSKDYEADYRVQLGKAQADVFQLSQKSLVVTVDDGEIGKVKAAVDRYMQLDVTGAI